MVWLIAYLHHKEEGTETPPLWGVLVSAVLAVRRPFKISELREGGHDPFSDGLCMQSCVCLCVCAVYRYACILCFPYDGPDFAKGKKQEETTVIYLVSKTLAHMDYQECAH